ncbi:isoprenyl transferase [Cryptosporidium sp. chipmunk genotype I]|uniref:isoprenyl transferase n=1 Tax=Cryptosporidium sp. chipmunk genotype I TaxID=1280935 RepID=UPI00351A618C|nr:isoprenyl transferase [Cryptosporidium sp. chipmunk genotype I]
MISLIKKILEIVLTRFLSIFQITHVAIILDGNRRFAKAMGISQLEGHKQGAFLLKKVLPLFIKLKVKYISMFVFSIENFSRDQENVDNTFNVIRDYILTEGNWLNEQNSKVVISGKIEMLPKELMYTLRDLELKTRGNTGIVLNICCAYSWTSELEMASNKYLESYISVNSNIKNQVQSVSLSDERFKSFIYNPEIPFPNILIRTSGETRLSDFLIYQLCHNTRIYFVKTLWPQISNLKILIIILHYIIFYL